MDAPYEIKAPVLGAVVYVIDATECHKGTVKKITAVISKGFTIELELSEFTGTFYYKCGVYKREAFGTEEELLKELKRRINGGKY